MQRFTCPPLSSPMLHFIIELNEKIFLDPNFHSIDAMLKLLTSFQSNLVQNNMHNSNYSKSTTYSCISGALPKEQ